MQPIPQPDPKLLEVEAKIASATLELENLRKKVATHEKRLARLERQRNKLKK